MISRRLEEYCGLLLDYNDSLDQPDWRDKFDGFACAMGTLVSGMNTQERNEVAKHQQTLYLERINQ